MQNSNCCQFTLMRQFLSFFCQFPKPLTNSNTCIFVNMAWKMNCDILKSKLIFCEWNAFYFIEIAFIGFTIDEIKQCIVFFWDTRYMNCLTLYCAVYQMRKIKMKYSPTLVLQFSYCTNMQIYQQKLRQISLWAIKLFILALSQMNSRHKSSKLNQSVLCFTISSYGFDFKCLIVSKQTQRSLK